MSVYWPLFEAGYKEQLLWNSLNDEIKELPTVAGFKTKIKT